MTDRADFDKHTHIRYNDLSHLFWGTYSVKVELRAERPCEENQDTSLTRLVDLREKLLKEIGMPNCAEWKLRREYDRAAFYFRSEPEALAFIDANVRHIRRVTRPRVADDVLVMGDRKIRVRKTLFHGRYRWSITFKGAPHPWMESPVTRECDAWIEGFFDIQREKSRYAEDEGRILYSYSGSRRVFLNRYTDVFAVKLSLHDHIQSVETIVLHSEVTPNGEKTPENG